MPKQNKYDIRIKAQIEIGGTYEAPDLDVAIENAKMQLRAFGEVSDIEVERAIYVDSDPIEVLPWDDPLPAA